VTGDIKNLKLPEAKHVNFGDTKVHGDIQNLILQPPSNTSLDFIRVQTVKGRRNHFPEDFTDGKTTDRGWDKKKNC